MNICLGAIKITISLITLVAITGSTPLYSNDDNQPHIIDKESGEQTMVIDEKPIQDIQSIVEKVNNTKPAGELIKTVYKIADLNSDLKLSDLQRQQPPECVRYMNNKLYIIYKYDGENYLFLMYDNPSIDSYPICRWYLGKKMYCADFEDLASKHVNIYDIQNFDKYGDYTSLLESTSSSIHSMHYTIDGYLIRLDYYDSVGEYINVSNITKYYGEDNVLMYNLAEIDRKLIQSLYD